MAVEVSRGQNWNMLWWRMLAVAAFLFSCIQAAVHTDIGKPKEYCQLENFNASCQPHEVIIIESALYGRMKIGRCIAADYHVGCSRDVKAYIGSKCSGRNNCQVQVMDPNLVKMKVCRADLVAYLEVSYTCTTVHSSASCGDVINVNDQGFGYIKRTSYNSNCHMRLSARPGQRLSLTLYDFSLSTSDTSSDHAEHVCQRYVEIQESGGHKEMVDCDRSTTAEKANFITQEYEIELKFLARTDQSPVILKYETKGCADVVPSGGATVFREKNQAVVNCQDRTWHLVCNGKKWIGEYDNCTVAGQEYMAKSSGRPVPLGLIMAIAIGIVLGVFFGVTMLALVICCRRRRQRMHKNRTPQASTDEALLRDPIYGPGSVIVKSSADGAEKVYQHRLACETGAPNMKGALQLSESVLQNLEKDRMDFDYGHAGLCGARDVTRRRDHEYESPRMSHDVRAYEPSSDNSIYRKCDADPRPFKVYTIQPGMDKTGSMRTQGKEAGYRPVPTDECFS